MTKNSKAEQGYIANLKLRENSGDRELETKYLESQWLQYRNNLDTRSLISEQN